MSSSGRGALISYARPTFHSVDGGVFSYNNPIHTGVVIATAALALIQTALLFEKLYFRAPQHRHQTSHTVEEMILNSHCKSSGSSEIFKQHAFNFELFVQKLFFEKDSRRAFYDPQFTEAIFDHIESLRKDCGHNGDLFAPSQISLGKKDFIESFEDEELFRLFLALFPNTATTMRESLLTRLMEKEALLTEGSYGRFPDRIRAFLDTALRLQPTAYYTMLRRAANCEAVSEKDLSSLSQTEKKTVYDVAYMCSNFHVHEPAENPIQKDQYSINLMWINKEKVPPTSSTFFGDQAKFEKEFIQPVRAWAGKNPHTLICVWYDGTMLERNTLNAVDEQLKDLKIALRDIRELEIVRAHPNMFIQEVPTFFRTDFLRPIILNDQLQKTQYAVYADLDVMPMSSSELFDKHTLSSLDEFGFVLAKDDAGGYENSFQILNRGCDRGVRSHKIIMIDCVIERFKDFSEEIKRARFGKTLSDEAIASEIFRDHGPHEVWMTEQSIYSIYKGVLTHFLQESPGYKGRKYPLEDLGTPWFVSQAHGAIPLDSPFKGWQMNKVMPTKPVSVPLSHFAFGFKRNLFRGFGDISLAVIDLKKKKISRVWLQL